MHRPWFPQGSCHSAIVPGARNCIDNLAKRSRTNVLILIVRGQKIHFHHGCTHSTRICFRRQYVKYGNSNLEEKGKVATASLSFVLLQLQLQVEAEPSRCFASWQAVFFFQAIFLSVHVARRCTRTHKRFILSHFHSFFGSNICCNTHAVRGLKQQHNFNV